VDEEPAPRKLSRDEEAALAIRARAAHLLLQQHADGAVDPEWLLTQVIAPSELVLARSLEVARDRKPGETATRP
jgi:hypothetical protein